MSGIHTDSQSRHERAAAAPRSDSQSPADRYRELFVAVQRENIFEDSKTFVDCAPLARPEDILAAYRTNCRAAGFDLGDFVGRHFAPQHLAAKHYRSTAGQPMAQHIEGLWNQLTRHPRAASA